MPAQQPPTAAELRAAFDAPEPMTLGLEEELMLLHPETFDLLPRAAALVEAAADERVKLEMPAAQLELSLPPERSVPAAIAALAAARRDLAAAAAPLGRLAAAGVHPFADRLGALNDGDRATCSPRTSTARSRASQLVCALQVHVAVGGADRSLAVYNGAAPVAAAARRARRQRAVPRRPRHRHGVDPARRSASSCRARASRPRSARGRRSPTRSPGAPRRARCRTRGAGGGSCGRTRVRDARGPRARRAGDRRGRRRGRWRSSTRSSAGSPSGTTPASRSRRPTSGGSRRTAGRPRAGAWTPSSPT